MPVTKNDLQTLGDVCGTVCYYLTAHLAAVGSGQISNLPDEVAQIYQLAAALPKPDGHQWGVLVRQKAGAAAAAAAAAQGNDSLVKEPGSRKRMKWTPEREAKLVRMVDDTDFRMTVLGKEGTRGGAINWASVARHFGATASVAFKIKYHELKGLPLPTTAAKGKKADEEAADGEKPAKKAKPAAPAAKEPPAPSPAGAATPAAEWTKKQNEELVKLVESEAERKTVLGKKRLRWKKIGEHFGHKSKVCRRQYTKLTGKEAPEDEE